jgi:pyruvate/2-oxoglutarate dehydrogenase complex dihydrolipoamide acyltransferase (E2) component
VAYLDDHPPARRQFRQRYAQPSGLIVVHTAESALDEIGEDTGAEGVAAFIARRSDPGSYHRIVDSDSIVPLVRFDQAAYGDGTGSNEFAIHLSFACHAADWPHMDPARRDAFLANGARAAREADTWLADHHGITVPARRVTRAQSDQRAAGFISHAERDPARRTDPGPAFPWDRFLTLYTQEDDMALSHDDKQWLEERFDALDTGQAQLKRQGAKIREKVTRLREKVKRGQTVTLAELDELQAELTDHTEES